MKLLHKTLLAILAASGLAAASAPAAKADVGYEERRTYDRPVVVERRHYYRPPVVVYEEPVYYRYAYVPTYAYRPYCGPRFSVAFGGPRWGGGYYHRRCW